MNRRYVLKRKARFFTIISVLVLSTFILALASTVYAHKEQTYTTITIRSGDTLWGLALKYKKEGDIRKYIRNIKETNNIDNGRIYPGDQLLIPDYQ